MASKELLELKVKNYLENLSPKARRMFLTSIESSKDKGISDKSLEMFVSVARSLERADKSKGARQDRIMRTFFRPIEPFLYSGKLETKVHGRIARQSIGRIWTWIVRDVAAPPLGALLKSERDGTLDDDQIDDSTADVRAETLRVVRAHLSDIRQLPRGTQRLSVQLGGDEQIGDLEDILEIFAHETDFENLLRKVPKKLTKQDLEADSFAIKIIKAFVQSFPKDASFAAAALLSRFEHTRLLTNTAMQLAKTDVGKTISASPYGAFIDILLSEVERHIQSFAHHQEVGAATAELVRDLETYHELVRAVEVDLELEGAVEWNRWLATLKRRMSELVTIEIEPLPAQLRRVLRCSKPTGEAPNFDPHLASDVSRALSVLTVVRKSVDSLAVNELQTRCWRAAEHTIETMTYALIDRLRSCPSEERQLLVKKLDAGIEYSRVIFGNDYAAALSRNRNSAASGKEKHASSG